VRERLVNVVDELAELMQKVGPVGFGGFFAKFANAFEDGFFGEGLQEVEALIQDGFVGVWWFRVLRIGALSVQRCGLRVCR